MDGSENAGGTPLEGGPKPLNPAQERIWFDQQRDASQGAYLVVHAWLLEGKWERARLANALQAIVNRHRSLRTVFRLIDGKPRACRLPPDPVDVIYERVAEGGLPEKQLRDWVEKRARVERSRDFDLENEPLFRVRLGEVTPDLHALLVVSHQLVWDEASTEVFWADLEKYYTHPSEAKAVPPVGDDGWPELSTDAPSFWRERLSGAVPPLNWHPDYASSAASGFAGGSHVFAIPPDLVSGLQAMADDWACPVESLLLGSWQIFLHRNFGEEDLLVGTSISWREGECSTIDGRSDLAAVRSRLGSLDTFQDLARANQEWKTAMEGPNRIAYVQLVDHLRQDLKLVEEGLFETFFAMRPKRPERQLGGIRARPMSLPGGDSGHLFSLCVEWPGNGAGEAVVHYRKDRFKPTTVARWSRRWLEILRAAILQPDRLLREFPNAAPGEYEEVVHRFNDTAREWEEARCLHDPLSSWARNTPTAVALADPTQEMTYRGVHLRSDALAAHLQGLGVKPDDVVGVLVPRSCWFVVGLFGVIKAGAAYLPLDSTQPEEHNRFLLKDSQAKALIVAHGVSVPKGYDGPVLSIEALATEEGTSTPSKLAGPRNLAYVIYTSGSTGRPKGTMIEHRSIVNRLEWMAADFPLGPDTVFFQQTRCTFDVSVVEFFLWSWVGGRLFLPPPNVEKDPQAIRHWVRQSASTWIHFVPSMLGAFLTDLRARGDVDSLETLKMVSCSGEAIPPAMVREFFESIGDRFGVTMFNLYGPTEAAVEVSCYDCSELRDDPSVPIGRPIANTQLHVLDPAGRALPVGVVGELHIGGVQVARGYLDREDLTAKAFIPDPFRETPGARLYKTGDLARWRDDGCLEYLGRNDFQIKIRGIRIEPGEIEAALREQELVAEAAVVAHPDASGGLRLIGYVRGELRGAAPIPEVLLRRLSERLPAVMVPAAIVVVETFPRSSAGKLNRKALPVPTLQFEGNAKRVPPRWYDPIEGVVAAIWEDLLGAPATDRHAEFFALGGHSLLAVSLVARVCEALRVEVLLVPFLKEPTIAGLAALAHASRDAEEVPAPERHEPALVEAPLTSGQARLWFQHQLDRGGAGHNIVLGFRASGKLDTDRLAEALEKLRLRHRTLRTVIRSFDGEPRQVVFEPDHWPEWKQYRKIPSAEWPHASKEALERAESGSFDLEKGPVCRAEIVEDDAGNVLCLLALHHLVADEWSCRKFMEDLTRLYGGGEERAPGKRFEVTDLAVWEQSEAFVERVKEDRKWWLAHLQGAPTRLSLPFDFPVPKSPRFSGRRVRGSLDAELKKRFEVFLHHHGATPFMGWMAAWGVFLGRLSGVQDLLVGAPVSLRDRQGMDASTGFLLNTLPFRIRWDREERFEDLLKNIREQSIDVLARVECPLEAIVRDLQFERLPGRNPVFQVMCTVGGNPLPTPKLGEASVSLIDHPSEGAKVDLTLLADTHGEEWWFDLEYRTDLFAADTITQWRDDFIETLDRLISTTEAIGRVKTPVGGSSLSGGSLGELPSSILTEIAAVAAESPEREVIVEGDRSINYATLWSQAGRVAGKLQNAGIGRGDRVVHYGAKRIESIITILGILRAGAAFVPLDAKFPRERSRLVAEDAQPGFIITERDYEEDVKDWDLAPVGRIEDLLGTEAADLPGTFPEGADPAYLIYTSGSTGRPKGVVVSHENLVASNTARKNYYKEPADRFLHLSSLSFDSSIAGLFWMLSKGGCLILPTAPEMLEAEQLVALMERTGTSALLTIPSLYGELIGAQGSGRLRALQLAIVAGEDCPPSLAKRHFDALPGVPLYNEYGPTEATVWTTVYPVSRDDASAPLVPIGRPVKGARVHLLDRHQSPVGAGEVGEIWIGGRLVAQGYWNNPVATEAGFKTLPGLGRVYRTGDRGRLRADGVLEFLGRADLQVKVNGHRVEIGEIESVLRADDAVQEVAVVICPVVRNETEARRALSLGEALLGEEEWGRLSVPEGQGTPGAKDDLISRALSLRERAPELPGPVRLHAFVEIRRAASRDLEKVRRDFIGQIHGAAVPTIEVIESLPRLPNGKIDREGLRRRAMRPLSSDSNGLPRQWRNETERAIAKIWADVLGYEDFGPDDDFFALGGDSLQVMRVVSLARERGIGLRVAEFISSPTIKALAEGLVVEPVDGETDRTRIVRYPVSAGAKIRLIVVHGIEGFGLLAGRLAARLPGEIEIVGIEAALEIKEGIPELARAYLEALAPVFEENNRPVAFAGYCFGGAVAFEMARQWSVKGHALHGLFVVDNAVPRLNRPRLGRVIEVEGVAGLVKRAVRVFARRRQPSPRPVSQGWRETAFVPGDDPKFFSDVPEERWELTRTNIRSISSYLPGKLNGSLTLLKTPPLSPLATDALGWERCVQGDLRIHVIPTDHKSIVKPPAVDEVARTIAEALLKQ
jgi:amino acid adenylation domain-containing protein